MIEQPLHKCYFQGNGEEAVKPKSVSRGSAHSSGSRMGNHQSMLKHSDSSFGLHSPDALNDDVQVNTLLLEQLRYLGLLNIDKFSFLTMISSLNFRLSAGSLSLPCPNFITYLDSSLLAMGQKVNFPYISALDYAHIYTMISMHIYLYLCYNLDIKQRHLCS